MRFETQALGMIAVLLALSATEGADQKPAEALTAIKTEQKAAQAALRAANKPGAPQAEVKKAVEGYHKRVGELGRRAVALADQHPDAPEAIEALLWARSAVGTKSPELYDSIYDMLADRCLDSDAILQVCAFAWLDTVRSTHAEAFLRAGLERSKNVKVRGRCCLSLGLHQKELAGLVRDLKDPVRGTIMRKNLERYGPAVPQRLRDLHSEKLESEAATYFERTIKEFGDIQPKGKESLRLGERAAGELFQMRHLDIGRKAPDVAGEDIDGKPMRLSDFRGKVVLISFWATWCGPCMRLVPHEKNLVEKMKDRPFALVGVNGDHDRGRAKQVSTEKGINWQSFWSGSANQGIPVQWGVLGWPTIYVLDADGVIRDNGLVFFHEFYEGATPDKMIEDLVAEAEKTAKHKGTANRANEDVRPERIQSASKTAATATEKPASNTDAADSPRR